MIGPSPQIAALMLYLPAVLLAVEEDLHAPPIVTAKTWAIADARTIIITIPLRCI